jgi:signal transduction histidine kinase/CheY-like chemotaxis protein
MNIRDIYDDLPVGVCIIRRDRKTMDVLYANVVMLAVLGLRSLDQAQGKKLEELWPDREVEKLVQQLKTARPPVSFVLPAYDRGSHKQRWIKFDITRDLWEDQDCYTLWATDISANKESEERLKAEVEKADALAQMKSNFLATMSHEIRTPMQTIYGFLELIAEEKPDERIQIMVDTARASASGLLEILDDILDLAKMDANKMDLDVFEVPVRTLVRGILEALAVRVHGSDIKLIGDIVENVPFVIVGDPKRLRQIIMNLCGNALKFTEKGSVIVRVTTKTRKIEVHKGQVGLRFEVIDSGIGMSDETCKKLFSSFTQADSSTSRKYGGTGLGLSISKKLVELMGGRIGVESEEGKGSTFWFEIPTEEVATNVTTVDLPSLDGISVLSVEDHPQGAKEIVNSLRSMGAKVESCPTYAEAIALIKRRPFDVGVIDQGLPDGLGLDLIKEAMNIRPAMGLIMYTVRDDVGLQHSLQALGVEYLTKPASRAGLGEAVKEAARKAAKINVEGPTRLLIAEDTSSVQDVLRRQLQRLDVEADFVSDGRQALEAIKTGKYGILITDLHMPGMDGYTLVEAIRTEEKTTGRHLPVIVLTADVQMAGRDVYMRYGFDECLLKPVSLGQFRRLLIRWGLMEDLMTSQEQTAAVQIATAKAAAVDINAMKELMGAFDESSIEMLHMFVDMTVPLIQKIRAAQTANNFHDLQETAHSLKGAARSACCPRLGDLAGQLQENAEKSIPSETLIQEIEAEFAVVTEEIKNLKVA